MQSPHRTIAFTAARRALWLARSLPPWQQAARLRYLWRCHARSGRPTPDRSHLSTDQERARVEQTREYWDHRVEAIQRPSGHEHFWRTFSAREYRGIAEQIRRATGLERGASVLDFGCGNGWLLELLDALGGIEGHGLDLSPAAIRWGQSLRGDRLDLRVGDIDSLAALPSRGHDLCLEVGVSLYMDRAAFLRLLGELLRISRRWVVLSFLHERPEADGWSDEFLVVPSGFWLGAAEDLSCLPGYTRAASERLRGQATWRTANGETLDVRLLGCPARTLFWPWYCVCIGKRRGRC